MGVLVYMSRVLGRVLGTMDTRYPCTISGYLQWEGNKSVL